MLQANIDRLQRVQNVLDCVVAEAPWTISSTNIRRDLHWLPVNHCIAFKLGLITWKTRHTTQTQPPYLCELITHYLLSRSLCSNTNLLARPYSIAKQLFIPGLFYFCTIYLELSAWTDSRYRQIINFQTPPKISIPVCSFRLVTPCQRLIRFTITGTL